MNIVHATFENFFGKMFVVARFGENRKIYKIKWHDINDGIIGKKLDYSFEELEPIALQLEEALQKYNA